MQETQVKSAFGQKSLTLERKLSISTRLLTGDWEQSVLFTACLSLFPDKDFCSRWKLIKHFNCSIVNSGQAQELLCLSDKTLPFPPLPSYFCLLVSRRTKNEYLQFLHRSLGSLRELDTQLIIAQRVKLADSKLFTPLINESEAIELAKKVLKAKKSARCHYPGFSQNFTQLQLALRI
jgi:hypothetical protein